MFNDNYTLRKPWNGEEAEYPDAAPKVLPERIFRSTGSCLQLIYRQITRLQEEAARYELNFLSHSYSFPVTVSSILRILFSRLENFFLSLWAAFRGEWT